MLSPEKREVTPRIQHQCSWCIQGQRCIGWHVESAKKDFIQVRDLARKDLPRLSNSENDNRWRQVLAS